METSSNPTSSVPEDGLLGLLEAEYLRRTTVGAAAKNDTERQILTAIYARFKLVLEDHGDVPTKEDLGDLCDELDAAQDEVAEELKLPKIIRDRLTKIRQRIKTDLIRRMGWSRERKEPLLRGGKPTRRALDVMNSLLVDFGEAPVEIEDTQWISAEEIRQSQALASILGTVAVADFWSHIDGSRFAFNDQTVQNLSQWIGDFETTGGIPINDIPIELLTWPSLSALKELLRNKLRDKLYSEQYRDSVQGVMPVLEELARLRSIVKESERMKLIDDLTDYFVETEDLTLPANMREGMGQEAEFPAKHQRLAMMEIKRQKQLLLADKTGGGKTGSSIMTFEHLKEQGKAKRALIMCPAEVVGEWEKRLTDRKGGYFKKDQAPKVVVIRKGKEGREQKWEEAKNADYVIMSIQMSRHETGGKSHVERAKEIGADFFVLDEAHNVRNPKGEDTENIFQISQCDSIRNGYTVVSTATPIYNTAKDIAALIRLLNAGQDRPRMGVPPDLDFSNIDQLSRAISGNHTRLVRNLLMLRTLRREGNDCLPVGTKLVKDAPTAVALSPLEQAVYDALKEDDPFFTATQKLHALRGICLRPQKYCTDLTLRQSTKYKQVLEAVRRRHADWLANPGTRSGKMLIAIPRIGGFARGTTRDDHDSSDPLSSDSENYIAGLLRKDLEPDGIPVSILDGKTSGTSPIYDRKSKKRHEDKDGGWLTKSKKVIASTRDHDGFAVQVMRTDVGGEGIDLTFISDVEVLSPPSVHSEETQVIGRAWRPGQKFDVHVGVQMLMGTIEQGMLEFALRKQRIIEMLMEGKPLSGEEEKILNDEISKVRGEGVLAYEAMSPRRKLMWIFNRIFAQGKDRVREMLGAQDGKYGKELAELYSQLDEYSHQGNNRRLLFTLLDKHLPDLKEKFGANLKMADIAAGSLSVAKHLQHRKDIDVWSSDLMAPMLEVGKKSLKPGYPENRITENAMDELPYEDESMHVAFHSLALQYTRNNRKKIGSGGDERMKSLHELNRVLAPGGTVFMALPTHIIRDNEQFETFSTVLEAYFGFEIVPEDTDLARSVDNEDEDPFESYVVTMRKIEAPTAIEELPTDVWKILNFRRVKHTGGNGQAPTVNGTAKKKPHEASYHTEFVMGGMKRVFKSETAEAAQAKDEHEKAKAKHKRVNAGIESLIIAHGSLAAVPLEKLMAFSSHANIDPEEQALKEAACRRLLTEYGSLDAIPIDEILKITTEILIRAKTNKGTFVSLARVDGEKKNIGGYGKKFFYQEEFTGVPEYTPKPPKNGNGGTANGHDKKKNGKTES